MRTFALVTVTMDPALMVMDPDDCTLEGMLVITDDPEEMNQGCEGGNHSVGPIFLTTIDGADCVITTCLACTNDEYAGNTIVSITPREDREPVT